MALPLSERMLIVLDAVIRGCSRPQTEDISTALASFHANLGVKPALKTLQALERRDYVEHPSPRFGGTHDLWQPTDAGRSLLAALTTGASNFRLIEAQELNLSVRGRLSPLAERTAA